MGLAGSLAWRQRRTALAQLALKWSACEPVGSVSWGLRTLVALALYALSFAAYLFVVRLLPLVKVAPVMTVGVVVLVAVGACLVGHID